MPAVEPPRFALCSQEHLWFGRWLGRGLSVAAMWPLSYAFIGKSSFDWNAMLFGGPGVALGLLFWAWCGYRIRNPSECLVIDRGAGQARLLRSSQVEAVCELDQLGAWSYTSWQGTGVWHAARCGGFATANLFVARTQKACQNWTAAVDRAARPFPADLLRYDDAVVDAIAVRRGLADRDALLWAATRIAAGRRELDAATLELAARQLNQTTLAERGVEAFDRLVRRIAGAPARLGLVVMTGLCALGAYAQLARTDSQALEASVVVAIGVAVTAWLWRAVGHPVAAMVITAVTGVAYVAKPWVAPIVANWSGVASELHPFSPTSETHMYFLLPGVSLCGLAAVMVATIKLDKVVAAAPVRQQVVELPPPRPEPPRPEPPRS